MSMSARQVDTMLRGFYKGTYDRRNLPVPYYKNLDRQMRDTVNVAFGSKRGHGDLVQDLSHSRQTFNAAKTYQMSKELQAAKRGAKSYDDYVNRAFPIYEKYERWAVAEENTAAANAQNAKQWAIIEAQADQFPKLRYSAIIDGNTSPTCISLNNLVLPVGHAMWSKYAPTNHYNCRCTLIQEERSVRTSPASKVSAVEKRVNETTDPHFKTNPGQTRELFPASHPYYTEVPQRDRAFARQNFGLPIQ